MRRRVYVEHLEPEVLAESATLDLLEKYRLEPIVALPPSGQSNAMARALEAVHRRGLVVGLWPLLTDDEGYWPSAVNAAPFVRRVDEALRFATAAGVEVHTVAIDLEPPLMELEELLVGSFSTRVGYVRRHRRGDAHDASSTFAALERSLAGRGVETIAAALPLVVLDLATAVPFWETVLRTPATTVPWSVVSPMLYTTMVAELLPTKSVHQARALLYATAKRLHRAVGPSRSSVSVGLVGRGKLGTEPIYDDPRLLALDVGAARAAGVDDLALFALEGVLSRRSPEAWLDVFVSAPPRRPPPVARAVAAAALSAAQIATLVGEIATRRR